MGNRRDIGTGDVERPPLGSPALLAFRYRDFSLLWCGLMLSSIGLFMQQFGLGWLVIQLAARDGVPQLGAFYLGLVGISTAIPGIVFGLFAGALADRADRRNVLLITQTAGGVVAMVLAYLTLTDHINIALVVLVNAMGAVAIAFDTPTRLALLPRLVSPAALLSAVGLVAVGQNAAVFIGPLLGGVFIGTIGVGGLMLTNAALRCAVVAVLLLLKPVIATGGPRRTSTLRSIGDGLSYSWQQPILRWALLMFGLTSLLSRPFLQLMPAVAHDLLHVGPTELSWLVGAAGIGAMIGSFLSASLSREGRRGLFGSLATLAAGLLVVALSFQRLVAPAVVISGAVGFAHAIQTNLATTILQSGAPDHLRGRVMSLQSMAQTSSAPVGAALLGSLGSLVGINYALLFGGGCVAFLGVFVLLAVPSLRDLRDNTSTVATLPG